MSLIWALMVLEQPVTERYFEILEYDKFNKPLSIRPLDTVVRRFFDPTNLYVNEKYSHKDEMPIIFSDLNNNEVDHDLQDLKKNGWLPYE
jgi:hypothetical protein